MVLQSMRKVKRGTGKRGTARVLACERAGKPTRPDAIHRVPTTRISGEGGSRGLAQGSQFFDVLIKMIVGEARDPGTNVATPLIVFEAAEEAKETSMARLEKMDAFFK